MESSGPKAPRHPRWAGLLLLAIAVFGQVPGASAQQQNLIQEIIIHGNRRIPADTIRARIFIRPGDVYDEASLQRDFNSLWNTGYFEDLRIEREESPKGWRIHVYVKEKPTIRTIDYKNLNAVSQSDVLERFKKAKVGLSVESQYDPTKLKRAEVILKELLAEHGRQFADIRTEVRPIPPAAVGVTFVVKEGPKVKVGRIKFEGNKKLNSRQLRAAMKNSRPIGIPHSIILENVFAKTYDATKLGQDAEFVRDAYQQKGYYKAIVADPKTEIRNTGGGFHVPLVQRGGGKAVDITVPIEEGDRFRLGTIQFKGGKAVTNQKALRALFPMKDGDFINVANLRKGLENLRKAYGELGYINFVAVPNTNIDDEHKIINVDLDLDEGKPYYVRRIEFTGNTTTRDKVIRRELAVEEGNVYNSRLWEFSLLRLNQLGYFEPLRPDQDSEIKQNNKEATVDINLKVRERGKNSIGLTGGVSGQAGSFIGLTYETNNFLGLGETLTVVANVGNRSRNVVFGFTEPYAFDRPLQLGFTVFTSKYDFNQARANALLTGTQVNLPQNVLDTFQNFTQSSTGFTANASYPLRRSLKRVGLTYSLDTSSVNVFSDASRRLFEFLAFRSNISGPNALKGIITSKVVPSFSFSNIDNPNRPHTGRSLFLGGEVSGLGGNVAAIRPIAEFKQFIPVNKGRNTLGIRLQGSFITGYLGRDANPLERFFLGGDNDLRGFDIRSVTPFSFLPDVVQFPLSNPDGTPVPVDPANPRRGSVTVPIPVQRIFAPGGDTSLLSNIEYRIPIVGPVTLAFFADTGVNFAALSSQLRISNTQLNALNQQVFGCPQLIDFKCTGGSKLPFKGSLGAVAGTNFVPRMSTGLELQVILPIVNAPFRIYYAYNPLLLDTSIATPKNNPITRSMFPQGGAGDFSYQQALAQFGSGYRLREPKKTFRFTVSTTF